jgi:hypothetical protein
MANLSNPKAMHGVLLRRNVVIVGMGGRNKVFANVTDALVMKVGQVNYHAFGSVMWFQL